MKRRRKGKIPAEKVVGVVFALSGVIMIIHAVPLYLWYAALALSVLLLLLLLYIT